jgi:hypothetical protein
MSSALPALLPIAPFARPVDGTVTLPGSKSLTNRALLLAALGDSAVELRGALFSEDTEIMSSALRELGIPVEANAATHSFRITGCAGRLPDSEASPTPTWATPAPPPASSPPSALPLATACITSTASKPCAVARWAA